MNSNYDSPPFFYLDVAVLCVETFELVQVDLSVCEGLGAAYVD